MRRDSTTHVVDRVFDAGVIVNMDIRYWGGSAKLTPLELGLEPGDVKDELMSLGRKKLVPTSALHAFRSAENRTYYLLRNKYCFAWPTGLGYYTPLTVLEKLRNELLDIQAGWQTATDAFIGDYRGLRAEMLRQWSVYLAMRTTDDKVARKVIQGIQKVYPEPEELAAKFHYSWTFFVLAQPTETGQGDDQDLIARARAAAFNDAYNGIRDGAEEMLQSVVGELRQRTINLLSSISERLRNGGAVKQSTITALQNWVDEFRQLDFAGDTGHQRVLDHLNQLMRRIDVRDSLDAPVALQEALRDTLQGIDRLPDSSSVLHTFGRGGVGARRVV